RLRAAAEPPEGGTPNETVFHPLVVSRRLGANTTLLLESGRVPILAARLGIGKTDRCPGGEKSLRPDPPGVQCRGNRTRGPSKFSLARGPFPGGGPWPGREARARLTS